MSNLVDAPPEAPIQRGPAALCARQPWPPWPSKGVYGREGEVRRGHASRSGPPQAGPERMGMMATGEGRYANLSPKFQHEITMDMLAYGFGRPAVLQVATTDDTGVTLVSRVLGVNDADI